MLIDYMKPHEVIIRAHCRWRNLSILNFCKERIHHYRLKWNGKPDGIKVVINLHRVAERNRLTADDEVNWLTGYIRHSDVCPIQENIKFTSNRASPRSFIGQPGNDGYIISKVGFHQEPVPRPQPCLILYASSC